MTRQLRTLIVGAVLCLVLGTLAFAVHVPYIIEQPGPTYNTLGKDASTGADIIQVSGHPVSSTSGNLNLMTVSQQIDDTTVLGAIQGWLAHDRVVAPHDAIYPPGTSVDQVNQQDVEDFSVSQDSAVDAAACELKYPQVFRVASTQPDSPNAAVLKAGDRFVSVAGSPVTTDDQLRAVLKKQTAGTKIAAVVTRGEQTTPVTLSLLAPVASSGSTTPRLGITVTDGCLFPFEVKIDLANIGGPSAGLMFSLGIIDKVSTQDLTHGRFIAGTGTIDPQGNVGEIGGIQLKMIAARRAGATLFLAPDSNCADVRGNIPSGLTVAKVSTLHSAIEVLNTVATGGTVAGC